MSSQREVVITGVGVVSPLGVGRETFWKSLCGKVSGIGPFRQFAGAELPIPFGAEITEDFEPKLYVKPRKSLKVMCSEIRSGFSAAVLALEDAQIDAESLDRDRFGVVLGAEMFYGEFGDIIEVMQHCLIDGKFHEEKWAECFQSDLYPLWMLKYLPNMVACQIAIGQDARGPNNTITLGEASSLLAMIESADVIRRGLADIMISGGSGSRINPWVMAAKSKENLSQRDGDPTKASRPFDAHRDGLVLGEGAGSLILESREHAEQRGAPILARILGWGSSIETCPTGLPGNAGQGEGTGIRNSIRMALRAANMQASDIGHVNAHGASTVGGDAVEAQAIAELLGDVPVTAPKGHFGNLGAGGGAVEATASVLALFEGNVPATLNYETPDPACPVNVVHGDAEVAAGNTALLLNQSGTGQATALIIERA